MGFPSLGSRKWELPTGTMNTTLVIGLAYIFLAYVVHPTTKYAYLRVRAYRAWRRIEEGERVDVTDYPTWMELLGGCARRDTARVVALLLLLFALALWYLELSIDWFPVSVPAYSQTLPPPVFQWSAGNSTPTPWHVLSLNEIAPEYEGDWLNQPNVFETVAKSRYYVKEYKNYPWSEPKDRYINGDIIVANWSRNTKPDNLVYGENATVMVDGITCSSGGKAQTFTDDPIPVTLNRTNGIEEWGTVLECDQGPAVVEVIGNSKPSIILTERETGDTHVIVEETSSEPSFLYSVWNATGASITAAAGNSSVEIAYAFHISSTVRLAEAVVTAIVNGVAGDGGGACFGLLRAYNRGPYDTRDFSALYGKQKARPFGEDPVSHYIYSLKDIENIIIGVEMNTNGMVAFALVIGLSFIGIALTLFLCPKYEMDIYNRDELLRATNLQAQGLPDDPSRHSAMRIEVQREDRSRHLTITISESDSERSGCARFLLRRGPEVTDDPVPATDNTPNGRDGVPFPRGPAHMYLGGVLTRLCKTIPRSRNRAINPEPLAPAMVLTASPVPSNAGSRMVSPTHPTAEGSSASTAATPTFLSEPGRGSSRFPDASLLFRSLSSDDGKTGYADDDEEEDADIEMGMYRAPRGSRSRASPGQPVHGPPGRGSPSQWFASPKWIADAGDGDETGGGCGGATGATGEYPFRVPSDTISLPVSPGTRPSRPSEV
ncbi:unnamed protein product [Ectocarpus sp. CCAP 1310/34]|nr:unnamed protein product [Ectocarpus sp. CCAP 1310/34]